MSNQSSLEKYTKSVEALNEHKAKNESVFSEHQRLLFSVIDAENELRDAVAESGEGLENEEFKVTVVPQTMKVYDEEKLKVLLTADKFAEVVTEQKRPPRISITPVKK